MPTTLALRFPWGRYHATPWRRHLNEGVTEWPPSCWRVLRGLYATWRYRAPDIAAGRIHALFEALAIPPVYWVPPAVKGESRHYMPDTAHRIGIDGNTDEAFDPFLSFERDGQVFVSWDVDLGADDRSTLEDLAGLLPYVGRADSICEGRLLPIDEEPEGDRVVPIEEDEWGAPTLRLLVPRRPVDLDELAVDTLDLRSRRLADPPGGVWVEYRLPPAPDERSRSGRPLRRGLPTTVRWAMVTPASPSMYAAVVTCDALRYACMSVFGSIHSGRVSATLSGKSAEGQPLIGHKHAHYFALDVDRDKLLDHLVLWAPRGLQPEDLRAITDVHELRGHGHVREFRPCRLGLEALGSVDDAAPELVGPSRVWRSATPFAPPRHRKRRQTPEEFLTQEVSRELIHRGLPEPSHVEKRGDPALAFRRHRIRDGVEDGVSASSIRVEFLEATRGPISIGALSHFGMGLLVPESV